jgi:hypothetical protein
MTVRVFSISAGLDASTVTPGSRPPVESRAEPASPLAPVWAHPAPTPAAMKEAVKTAVRNPVTLMSPSFHQRCMVGRTSGASRRGLQRSVLDTFSAGAKRTKCKEPGLERQPRKQQDGGIAVARTATCRGISPARQQTPARYGRFGYQPVVEVWRRAETREAPRGQGATTENTGSI